MLLQILRLFCRQKVQQIPNRYSTRPTNSIETRSSIKNVFDLHITTSEDSSNLGETKITEV